MSDKTIKQLDDAVFPLAGDSFVVGRGTDTLKLSWDSLSGAYNVKSYGAKADGVTDDGPAILATVQAAWNAGSYVNPPPSVYVPRGTYRIATPIDFTTLTLAYDPNSWSFVCDPGAVFVDATTAGPVINVSPPVGVGRQLFGCTLHLGRILGKGSGSNIGVVFSAWNDSFVDVGGITAMGGSGFYVDAPVIPGTFNNNIRIGYITSCGAHGFQVKGNATVWGFQGNLVWIGQTSENLSGVVVDTTVGLNSVFNMFQLGPVENNRDVGVFDNSGTNSWDLANTNGNVTAGFVLGAGAGGVPVVRGYIGDGVITNNQTVDCVNSLTATGNVAAPAVPATTVAQRNTFDRPAKIYVNGGTVSAIAINGANTGATTGSFRLLPGQTIKLTYTVAPTWTWFLE